MADFDAVDSYKELMGKPQDIVDHPDRNSEMQNDLVRGMTYSSKVDTTSPAYQGPNRNKKVPY